MSHTAVLRPNQKTGNTFSRKSPTELAATFING